MFPWLFLLSFLFEITLTNIYLNLNGFFTLKVPKCEREKFASWAEGLNFDE